MLAEAATPYAGAAIIRHIVANSNGEITNMDVLESRGPSGNVSIDYSRMPDVPPPRIRIDPAAVGKED